jgi:hypothetical protein
VIDVRVYEDGTVKMAYCKDRAESSSMLRPKKIKPKSDKYEDLRVCAHVYSKGNTLSLDESVTFEKSARRQVELLIDDEMEKVIKMYDTE